MTRLNEKTAVITGGATGIGRAAAKRFIEEGAFVFIFGRRQEALDAAVADLGPNARAVNGSVSDLADLDRLYAAVKAERGTLDIVFANAGAGSPLPLGKITAEHIDEIFDTNVKGSIFTVQKALPLMSQGGSIILTGSSAGTTGAPAFSAYSASKATVRNLARTWAQDLKGTGIRVNVLSPGPTATELAKEALGEEGMKAFASMNPLQRMANPAEIGAVAAFLASQDSSFMTPPARSPSTAAWRKSDALRPAGRTVMNTQYSIVGSGPVGRTLAGLFARTGIDVQIANSRGPDSMAAIAKELGRHVAPVTLERALDADVIFLAVGFLQVPAVAAKRSDWSGKLVVDVTNALQPAEVRETELRGLLSSEINAEFVAGAKLVKAFNHLPIQQLGANPPVSGQRQVVFVSSNDADASATIAALAARLGFAPVELGRLDEGGVVLNILDNRSRGLLFQNLFKKEP